MRSLKARDIAPFTKILAKMEIKDSLKTVFGNAVNGEKMTGGALTAELLGIVIENYYKAEKEFFAFIADLNGTTSAEISDMDLPDFINLIKELFSAENMGFFKSAVK